jgi:hypothetical protein
MRMTQEQLNSLIASAVQTALVEASKTEKTSKTPKTEKTSKTSKAYVKLEPSEREGVFRVMKYWENGGHRSLCSLSRENLILLREALKNL